MKGYLVIAIVAIAIAIVNKVSALRNIVFPAA